MFIQAMLAKHFRPRMLPSVRGHLVSGGVLKGEVYERLAQIG